MKVKSLSHVQLFATPWTEAHQAPLSMGFSRQEYWSGLPFPSPGNLPYPGIEPRSPTLQADALTSEPRGKWKGWDNITVVPLKNTWYGEGGGRGVQDGEPVYTRGRFMLVYGKTNTIL